MKVAAVQMNVRRVPADNIDTANRLTAGLAPSVVLLPELFTTGFDYELIGSLGADHPDILRGLDHRHTFLGSIIRKTDTGTRNAFFVHEGGVTTFIYDKMHLFPPMAETEHFEPGDRPSLFDLNGVTAGAVVCFDLRFPELTTHYLAKNAAIIFAPAEWPAARSAHLRTLTLARAIENQAFVVMTNTAGSVNGTEFGGGSMIVSPLGEIIRDAGNEPDAVITADIDPADAARLRADFPLTRHPSDAYR